MIRLTSFLALAWTLVGLASCAPPSMPQTLPVTPLPLSAPTADICEQLGDLVEWMAMQRDNGWGQWDAWNA
jgi:hypothetical protein